MSLHSSAAVLLAVAATAIAAVPTPASPEGAARLPARISPPVPDYGGGFGYALASVPDIDGDDVLDLAVGEKGRATIYSGASGELLTTAVSPARVGVLLTVAGVPDVDGDGAGDLLAGAGAEPHAGISQAGTAYLFSGATGSLLRSVVSPAPRENGFFGGGNGVAGLTDVDGDGRGDLLVGAVGDGPEVDRERTGRAYAFSGATGELLRTFPAPAESFRFGDSVLGTGDLNGDGTTELLIGAPRAAYGEQHIHGRAHVYDGVTGRRLRSLQPPDPTLVVNFGADSDSVPDVDRDGVPDLAVGAPGFGASGGSPGFAYVFSGASGALLATRESTYRNNNFGEAVAGVSDRDGDGSGDLLVGQDESDAAGDGEVYLFTAATSKLFEPPGNPGPDDIEFGASVVGLGDVDDDGLGDFAVSAPGTDKCGGLEESGAVYLFRSGDTPAAAADATLEPAIGASTVAAVTPGVIALEPAEPAMKRFGASGVSRVPDVDGDGRDDILAGLALYTGATGAYLRTIPSPDDPAVKSFGSPALGVPDATGDGRGDIVVGGEWRETDVGNWGQAWLLDGVTGRVVHTWRSQTQRGYSDAVSGVPDIDGDGRGDVIVGSAEDDLGALERAGQVYVYSGATGALLRTLQSPAAEDVGLFGGAVAGTPDLDDDGRGDILVGAGAEAISGQAYLFSGATGELLHTLARPAGPLVSFGIEVTAVPDFDGDGGVDLGVGTYTKPLVFSGTSGELLYTFAGRAKSSVWPSIAGVPDTDGDGLGELLLGTDSNPVGDVEYAGTARLLSLDGVRRLPSPDPQHFSFHGAYVAGLDDVDGDGLGDVVVTADGEDACPVVDRGNIYLYQSGR